MTTRTAIRQQNAERRLRHAAWEVEPILPPLAVWSMVAVMLFFIVPLIMGSAS